MNTKENFPECKREDCLACVHGHCIALVSTGFGDRDCSFYKKREEGVQNDPERMG